MKKLLSIFISIILVLSVFSGCAKNKDVNPTSNQPSGTSTQATTDNTTSTNQTTQTTQDTSNTNTENTAAVTNETQNSTGQDTKDQSITTDNTKTKVPSTSSSSSKDTGVTGGKNLNRPAEKPTNTVKQTPALTKDVNLYDVLNKAVLFVEKSASAKDYKISDWDAVALRISGRQLNSKYIEFKGEALGKEIDNYYMTDYARTILGIMSAGYDPNNFQGIDLVSIIKNSATNDGKFKDTIKGGEDLVNCHVWSMIALEASGTNYDRQKALEYLEGKQNKDGGFYIFAPYPDSDVDFTAMSVLALTMAGRDSKSPFVSNALNYLKSKLVDMGKDPKLETAETLSVILEAIVAAGDDVNNYKVNDKNIVDELLTFRDTTGGFKHLKTGSVNDIATRQVVTAIGFYKNNKSMYKELNFTKNNFFTGQNQGTAFVKIHNASYDVKGGTVEFEALAENVDEVGIEITNSKDSYTEVLKPEKGIVKISKSLPESEYDIIVKGTREGNVVYIYNTKLEKVNEKIKASVRIESYDKNVLYDKDVTTGNVKVFDYDGTGYTQGKVTVYSFVMKALNSMEIKSNVSYSYGAPYIASINDIAGGKFGGWDGWMYFVNGKDPGVGMTDVEVKAGDEILVYYGDWGIMPLNITLPETASKGQNIQIIVKSEDKGVENAAVWVGGKKYTTDTNGIATITIEEVGNLEVYAEKLDDTGKPLFVRSVKKVIVVK